MANTFKTSIDERGISFKEVREIRERLPRNAYSEISSLTRIPKHSVVQEFNYEKSRALYRREILEAAIYLIERETAKNLALIKKLKKRHEKNI